MSGAPSNHCVRVRGKVVKDKLCSVDGCPKRVRLSQLKPVLTGETDLDDVILSVDKDVVDATFGLGV